MGKLVPRPKFRCAKKSSFFSFKSGSPTQWSLFARPETCMLPHSPLGPSYSAFHSLLSAEIEESTFSSQSRIFLLYSVARRTCTVMYALCTCTAGMLYYTPRVALCPTWVRQLCSTAQCRKGLYALHSSILLSLSTLYPRTGHAAIARATSACSRVQQVLSSMIH